MYGGRPRPPAALERTMWDWLLTSEGFDALFATFAAADLAIVIVVLWAIMGSGEG